MFGTRLRNQHPVERIAMPLRQGDQRLAVIGQHREQLKTIGNRQEALVRSDAVQRHQYRDFPEADGADVTRPRVVERAPFAGGEPFRCDPRPEHEMGVDQDSGDHLLGSKSRTTSSGRAKSSDRNTPASSPYLIGCRRGSGPRQATARPLRVTTIVSPASARATSAANRDLACATDTVVPKASSNRSLTIDGQS